MDTIMIERAEPLTGPRITDEGAQLLRALARGLTDDAVCHTLGWSRRKFRRVLTNTMSDLGAQSRFQAGFLFGAAQPK